MENEMQNAGTENALQTIPKNEIVALYKGASTLTLTKEESQELTKDFDDSEIEIRPDGHIYLPQSYYRNRLNQVLGIGQWALIVRGTTEELKGRKRMFLLNGILVVRGTFVSEAVGEAEIHESNDNQSSGSVWEAAKSDAITRCCKDMSIARQIYQPTYIRQWQEKYAVQVWIKDKSKPQWRKKESPPFRDETGPVSPDRTGFGMNTAPFNHPDERRTWLNKTSHQGTVITMDWQKAVDGLANETITIGQLEEKFKISKQTRADLEIDVRERRELLAKEKSGIVVPEAIQSALLRCRTKQDVDKLSLEHKENIKKFPRWYDAFVKQKQQLPLTENVEA